MADINTAEEIKDASYNLPRAMMWALYINGLLGFVMLITFCFCVGNVGEILKTSTGFPFIQVFYNATNSLGGASTMTAILIILTVAGAISNVATASRQMFAFARDNGLPFSRVLAHVRLGWNIPLNAVLVSLVITCLLSLINIGSTVAFEAIASLGNASLTASYLVSFFCLVRKRLRGERLPYARWSLGRYGLLMNIAAILFLLVILVFSFFPTVTPVEGSTMNWSILLFGAAIIFAVFYYFFIGRRTYTGPVVLIKYNI